MTKSALLLVGLFLFSMVCSVSAQESVQEDGFKIESLTDGTQMLLTPFLEAPVYGSDLRETPHKGQFTFTQWNEDHTVFTVKTSDGEQATFTKGQKDSWQYVNYVNGILQDTRDFTWVGRKFLMMLSSYGSVAKTTMQIAGEKIIISQDGVLSHSESFSLPKGIGYKLFHNNQMMLIWDKQSYTFKQGSLFGDAESQYVVVYPSLWKSEEGEQSVMWHYQLGHLSSGANQLNESVNELMVSILSRECQNLGKNRYGEIEIKSASGRSSLFLNEQERTTRLGMSWKNGGRVYHGMEFIVDEGEMKWKVLITGNSYTAEQIK